MDLKDIIFQLNCHKTDTRCDLEGVTHIISTERNIFSFFIIKKRLMSILLLETVVIFESTFIWF